MIEEHLAEVEKRLERLEQKWIKAGKEKTLKEKFMIHDFAKTLELQFNEVAFHIPDNLTFQWKIQSENIGAINNVKEELNRIVNELISLVDRALA